MPVPVAAAGNDGGMMISLINLAFSIQRAALPNARTQLPRFASQYNNISIMKRFKKA